MELAPHCHLNHRHDAQQSPRAGFFSEGGDITALEPTTYAPPMLEDGTEAELPSSSSWGQGAKYSTLEPWWTRLGVARYQKASMIGQKCSRYWIHTVGGLCMQGVCKPTGRLVLRSAKGVMLFGRFGDQQNSTLYHRRHNLEV